MCGFECLVLVIVNCDFVVFCGLVRSYCLLLFVLYHVCTHVEAIVQAGWVGSFVGLSGSTMLP